ncbi:sigma 54-interacting transcriptional regulator [Aeoliella sp. ICT_H6.2]|uniref:Sigma 54-interacting transcriptional regulator n=1 Tax=Aeoliella straminimaris TaxID=2954799 RepID=A0A9X2F9A6_9BACT|nr:sigma 54-interacting transcriptional regulator [Aeoliella straminimaris]
MALLASSDWRVAVAIAEIGYANPFLPERIELEQEALGKSFTHSQPFLQYRPDCSVSDMFPNAPALRQRSEQLLEKMRGKLIAHEPATERELEVYENLAIYQLYARYMSTTLDLPAVRFRNRPEDDILNCYDAFAGDYHWFLELPEKRLPSNLDRDVIFAGLFQVERAFFHIFRHIVGASMPAARLRAAIWQSIFTHDMRRYLSALHRFMGDIPTLITGPSGTGKELVAQSIAYSRFFEFDSKNRRFVTNYADCFVGLNLTAISPTLIESELFGHAKGAFTDAKTERRGYLDESECPRWGTVFLDEIGDLDAQLQVKLLRVLQSREFQRVGDSTPRKFVGKIIAATNRDLAAEMEAGRFREDFYYRLCADRIETPSLRVQLQESPEDIANFVRFIATRQLPELPEEASRLTDEVVIWVSKNLGKDYAWPGNIRELEQCVRSIMIRGNYVPSGRKTPTEQAPVARFLKSVEDGDFSRDELLSAYFSLVYSRSGSYRAAGRRLGVDWRTVKEIVDSDLAREFAE